MLTLAFAAGAQEITAAAETPAVMVGKPSPLRNLVPPLLIDKIADFQYLALKDMAQANHTLLPHTDPLAQRLQMIAMRLFTHATLFNPTATDWAWEVNLIKSSEINAFCLPGGRIIFYSALIDDLQLSDVEIAVIMGHEMAHALRDHARVQIAKYILTSAAVGIIEIKYGDKWGNIAGVGKDLLNLKFSRNDETEADIVGLELAARAGFDPNAGITFWQKMSRGRDTRVIEFLSTHPSHPNRIATIQKHLKETYPIYLQARQDLESKAPTN